MHFPPSTGQSGILHRSLLQQAGIVGAWRPGIVGAGSLVSSWSMAAISVFRCILWCLEEIGLPHRWASIFYSNISPPLQILEWRGEGGSGSPPIHILKPTNSGFEIGVRNFKKGKRGKMSAQARIYVCFARVLRCALRILLSLTITMSPPFFRHAM